MALTLKSIAAGVIKSTVATVLVPGSATKNTLVTKIYFCNLHSVAATLDYLAIRRYISTQAGYQDFTFYKRAGGIATGAVLAIDDEITLGLNFNNGAAAAPDQIIAKFSTVDSTNGVSFAVSGIERDL